MNYKNLGLYKVVGAINNFTYKFESPQFMNDIFLVFHLWLLHFDKSDPLPGQIILPLLLIWFDKKVGLGEYIAKEILNLRINKRKKDPVS